MIVTKAATLCCLVLVSFCATLCASPDKKGEKPVGKLLFGKVLDSADNPLPDAVVYVTNTRSRAVKTYIVGKDGAFRFPALTSVPRTKPAFLPPRISSRRAQSRWKSSDGRARVEGRWWKTSGRAAL